MKKLVFMFVAIAAMGMVSCGGNKTEQGAACDSAACDSAVCDSAACDSAACDSAACDSAAVAE